MQVITDLNDRDLYARLRTDAELRRALDTNIEPWHMPHFNAHPAEASSELLADDEGDRSGDAPEGAAAAVLLVLAIVAACFLLHGWRAGWFA